MEQLGSESSDVYEILMFEYFFQNYVERKQDSLKLTRLTGTVHEDQYTYLVMSRLAPLRLINASGILCRENQNTHFMFNKYFFRKSCLL